MKFNEFEKTAKQRVEERNNMTEGQLDEVLPAIAKAVGMAGGMAARAAGGIAKAGAQVGAAAAKKVGAAAVQGGIRPGDRLLEVDGKSMQNATPDVLRGALRGQRGQDHQGPGAAPRHGEARGAHPQLREPERSDEAGGQHGQPARRGQRDQPSAP